MVIEVVKFVEAPETSPAVTNAVSMIGNDMMSIVTATTTTMITPALILPTVDDSDHHGRLVPMTRIIAMITVTLIDKINGKLVIAMSNGVLIPLAVDWVALRSVNIDGSAIAAKTASNTTTTAANINLLVIQGL